MPPFPRCAWLLLVGLAVLTAGCDSGPVQADDADGVPTTPPQIPQDRPQAAVEPVPLDRPLFMEMSSFDGVPYYGNWMESDAWYVKRHSHASGGAFVVAHEGGAVMDKRLSAPLAPGTYDVLLRTCLMRSHGTENVVRVSLGNLRDGTFVPEASATFTQDWTGSRYSWHTVGEPFAPAKRGTVWKKTPSHFKLSSPARLIRVEAVKVENMGIGDDPEYPEPYIILDSLMITAQPYELVQDRRNSVAVRFPDGRDPRETAARMPSPDLAAPLDFGVLPKSQAFVSAKNLLRNSSFELGLKPHYGCYGATINGNNLDANCLTTDNPWHGRTCVELTPHVQNLLDDYTGSEKELRYGGGFTTTALHQWLGEELDALRKAGPLTVSAYVRTNGREVRFRLGGASFTTDSTQWKRYSAPLPKNLGRGALFTFSADPQARVYVDALQIERGEQPTAYMPLEGLEVGFQVPRRCHVCYRQENTLPLELVACQAGGQAQELTVRYKLLSPLLRVVERGTAKITTKPDAAAARAVALPARLGAYLLTYEVDGHPEQTYAVPIGVVDDPQTVPRTRMCGAIVSTNEEIMQIFHHAGFDWVNTLNDRLVYHSTVWPARDEMHFYDRWWKLWQDKYDIQYGFWSVPFVQPPKWDQTIRGREAAAHMGRPNMSYETWAEYWDRIVAHTPYLDVYIPTDELTYHRGPGEALKYIDIAVRQIRKHDPDATIAQSTQATGVLEMLRRKPDLDLGDALGGSRHNHGRNSYYYDRHVKQRTGKEYWVLGVGWTTGQGWYTAINFETLQPREYHDAPWWALRWAEKLQGVRNSLFNQAAVVGVRRWGFYTAKFDSGRDPYSAFPWDNSLKPYVVTYINMVNFLRNHEPGGLLHFERAYGVAAAWLQRNGKTCVMIEPDGGFASAVLHLGALPADGVQLYGPQLTPVDLPADGRLTLPLGGCVFIEDAGMGGEKLLAAVRGMEAHPAGQQRRLVLPAGEGVELATFEVDGPALKKTDSVALPAGAGRAFPIDASRAGRAGAWASVAPKVPAGTVTLDGRLDEAAWKGSAPSFVYCWAALDGSYGALQGIEGFGDVLSLQDISSTHRVLWDGETIYFAFELLDDRPEKGDQVRIELDADLLGDLGDAEVNEDDYTLIVEPDGRAVLWRGPQTAIDNAATVKTTRGRGRRHIEIALPAERLGIRDGRPRSLGMNVELTDVDGDDEAVLSWTGNFAPRHSPRGYGQLVLTD